MRLYVLVRSDLSGSQQAVQAGHAVAQHILNSKNSTWNNETLIYLSVKDEKELLHWKQKLDYKEMEYHLFHEPDIGNQLTALACATEKGRVFQSLTLMAL